MCVYSGITLRKFYCLLWSSKYPPTKPPHLFWVVPDVTWAESLSERTFHGNEVRVMVCPGAKRSAWNTKRRTPWKPRPDSAEQSLALVHLKTFIKTVCACVCVREENMWCFILGKATWIPSEVDLHTLKIWSASLLRDSSLSSHKELKSLPPC